MLIDLIIHYVDVKEIQNDPKHFLLNQYKDRDGSSGQLNKEISKARHHRSTLQSIRNPSNLSKSTTHTLRPSMWEK